VLAHILPLHSDLLMDPLRFKDQHSLALCPDAPSPRNHQVPRAPLPLPRRYLFRWDFPSHQRALPLLLRSYGLMRQTPILSMPPASASVIESLQVAASPCWMLALPDVISAGLSLDAWPHTPASPPVPLPVSSQRTPAFPPI